MAPELRSKLTEFVGTIIEAGHSPQINLEKWALTYRVPVDTINKIIEDVVRQRSAPQEYDGFGECK